ncbi:MAG: YceI family protein [Flavobacteriaceae bacterium]|nr:YceI family protein [Flavobacteriaceae bacterium]
MKGFYALMGKNSPAFFMFLLVLSSCGDGSEQNKTTAQTTDYQAENKPNPAEKESNYKKELQWTAYKTDRKVPVTGTFKTISLVNTKEDKLLEESLDKAKFYCDGTSVTSGDAARDGTLVTFFFKRLSSADITGYFGKFENNKVAVTMSLNGKTVTKDFSYSIKKNTITIKGSVDILTDFNAQKAFTGLHRACYDLHEGKTWSEIDLTIKISK